MQEPTRCPPQSRLVRGLGDKTLVAFANRRRRRVAERRRNQLMKEQAKISAAKLRSMVGKTVRVLLEGPSNESELLLQGRMETQAPDIDGRVLINDAGDRMPTTGQFYQVEITESLEYDVIGRLCE